MNNFSAFKKETQPILEAMLECELYVGFVVLHNATRLQQEAKRRICDRWNFGIYKKCTEMKFRAVVHKDVLLFFRVE